MKDDELKLAVIGLGYVGLPLSLAFEKNKTIGYDKDKIRINELNNSIDRAGEFTNIEVAGTESVFSFDKKDINDANIYHNSAYTS